MGWEEGEGLGKLQTGRKEPVSRHITLSLFDVFQHSYCEPKRQELLILLPFGFAHTIQSVSQ